MRVSSGWAGAVVGAGLLMSAPDDARADLAWLGAHAAYYDELGKGAIGLHARENVGHDLTAGFKGDYIFRSRRTTWAFDVDLEYELPFGTTDTVIWVGGGAGIVRDDIDGPSRAKIVGTASAILGAGRRYGPLLPFAEVRLTSQETARWVFYIGLRF